MKKTIFYFILLLPFYCWSQDIQAPKQIESYKEYYYKGYRIDSETYGRQMLESRYLSDMKSYIWLNKEDYKVNLLNEEIGLIKEVFFDKNSQWTIIKLYLDSTDTSSYTLWESTEDTIKKKMYSKGAMTLDWSWIYDNEKRLLECNWYEKIVYSYDEKNKEIHTKTYNNQGDLASNEVWYCDNNWNVLRHPYTIYENHSVEDRWAYNDDNQRIFFETIEQKDSSVEVQEVWYYYKGDLLSQHNTSYYPNDGDKSQTITDEYHYNEENDHLIEISSFLDIRSMMEGWGYSKEFLTITDAFGNWTSIIILDMPTWTTRENATIYIRERKINYYP